MSSVADEALVDDDLSSPEARSMFLRTEMLTCANLAWPLLVSFFSRMAMASVDSAFVGHIPSDDAHPGQYLAACVLADMSVSLLILPPLAFNQSLNALVSQAVGSGNKKQAGVWLQLSLFWLTVTYIPVLVAFFFVEDILTMLRFDKNICELGGLYAKWNVFWPIPNGWYQCMRFYFQAQGKPRPAMYNNLMFLFINVLLNWIFVFGGPFRAFGWNGFGFVGAAMSISCSRCGQPITYWLYMFKYTRQHEETWPGWTGEWKNRENMRKFLAMSLPQMGTMILSGAIGQVTTFLTARLGEMAVSASSAFSAVTTVLNGAFIPTLSAVAGIRVGFYLGQGSGVRSGIVSDLVLYSGLVLTTLVSVLVVAFPHALLSAVTDKEAVVATAVGLRWPVAGALIAGIYVQVGTSVITSQGRPILTTILSFCIEMPMTIGVVGFVVFVGLPHVVNGKFVFEQGDIYDVYWVQFFSTAIQFVILFWLLSRSDWRKYAHEAQVRQSGAAAPSDGISMRDQQEDSNAGGQCERDDEYTVA
jgi:MATE family multidrug resistance protein